MAEKFTAYMDATDFHTERGQPAEGNRLFATMDQVLREHKCARSCGVVKVEVTFVSTVRFPADETEGTED